MQTRDAAWLEYQASLGNLTQREESVAERAFKAGWTARESPRGEQPNSNPEGRPRA